MQDKSRKILIFATSYLPLIGGAELAVKGLTDHLSDFSFDLITARPNKELAEYEKLGNVNVFRVNSVWSRFNFFIPKIFLPVSIFFKAKKLLALNKYDMIYVLQASQAGGAAWLLKKLNLIKQPIVLNIQEGKILSQQPFLFKYVRRLIIGSADYWIVISNYLKDFIVAQGVPPERVFLIPNGVDAPNDKLNNYELKEKLGLGAEKVIITISRLVEKNGLADLIRSISFIKDNYPEPIKLLIVGDAEPHLSLETSLKSLVKNLGLVSDVIFVGFVKHEDSPLYLSLADVFVRPSYSEGLGTAFLEAMAAGVPIIGTRVGGIVDFLKDGDTGLYCNVGDGQDIGRKIIQVLSNKELHDKLSRNGLSLIKEKYDWNIVTQQFQNFYESITN